MRSKVILLWGIADTAMTSVAQALAQSRRQVHFLDQRQLASKTAKLQVDASGLLLDVTWPGMRLDLASVTAAYIRPYDTYQLSVGLSPSEVDRARRWSEILWSWADLTDGLVLNRPAAMANCMSKPGQLATIAACGFDVPQTLLTTSPDEAEAFWAKHGTVLYKSTSSTRSVVCRLSPAHRARFADLGNCPTQFQERVTGTDYRVHVIGHDVFCSRIVSDADDYRYPDSGDLAAEIAPAELPGEIAGSCRALSTAMGLPLAGIDLRRTPQGRWFCFEINPSPAFSYYDVHPTKPLAAAVARLLADAS